MANRRGSVTNVKRQLQTRWSSTIAGFARPTPEKRVGRFDTRRAFNCRMTALELRADIKGNQVA
jgi:hypothetical protein